MAGKLAADTSPLLSWAATCCSASPVPLSPNRNSLVGGPLSKMQLMLCWL
jgi:hypothetical protein